MRASLSRYHMPMTDVPKTPVTAPDEPASVPNTRPARNYSEETTARAQRDKLNTDRAITLHLSGRSQAESYSRAFRPRGGKKVSSGYASEWFNKASVQERMDEICLSIRATDSRLDNPGRILADLLALLSEARAAGNHTACMGYMNQRERIAGMIVNNTSITVECWSSSSWRCESC